ncbi:mannose-6-phosphate isomerase-like protein (cupin superfamily) [Methylobacterium brachiatum]|uniref:Mannose-6-phosphate isomerase-like protein (Cupin superfamily) n=1 Tax=Methylobacterium brachiatum TaxID=269660 RepID=A0AAJ1TTR9_9HYPH|nr:cupin domain-containing protein [Methylobacterium brachiatum]MCB4803038.1 cupin domain-containing protein [Methylobacterium brachiatum]MDQ0543758.1 mannose-6-phosphate isomerase-like protein (cupin superfamily) [Methylobacterium brachiatum]
MDGGENFPRPRRAGATAIRFAAHKAGTREIFHILSGRLEIHTTREVITLEGGDTATIRVDVEHGFVNVGSVVSKLILLILSA